MDVPSNLRAVYETGSPDGQAPVCVPLSALFWGYMTTSSSSSESRPDLLLDEAYGSCLTVAAETPQCDGYHELLKQARVGVQGDNVFPGPMCSPLRRLDLPRLKANGYTFTEKSDGVRTIVVVRTCDRFPSWFDESHVAITTHLAVTAQLEAARRQLQEAKEDAGVTIPAVHLLGGQHNVRLSRLSQNVQSGGLEAYMCTLTSPDSATPTASFVVHRSLTTMPVAFALDRAMDNFYILCEGATALQANSAVLDGELMLTCRAASGSEAPPPPSPRYVLGLFDVFSYTTVATPMATVSLATASMNERYALMQSLIHSPDSSSKSASASTSRVDTLCWYVKTMWRIEQFTECLTRLQFDANGHFYYYAHQDKWCTKNDGFVFTPDHFPIVSGASASQLKWKWQRSLSVDWKIRAQRPGGDLYDMSLFFRKIRFGYQEDTLGHWKLQHPWELDNPHGFTISTKPSEAVIAECVYDRTSRRWAIERLRGDKKQANSITTAISVLESLAEDLTLAFLLKALDVSDDRALSRAAELDQPVSAPPHNATGDAAPPVTAQRKRAAKTPPLTAPLSVRAVATPGRERSFYLYWCTTASGNADCTRPIPAPLCRVRDCAGFGTEVHVKERDANLDTPSAASCTWVNAPLEALLYIELANAGGSYGWSDFIVDACFNGSTGRWEIIRMHPHARSKMASFELTVLHLQWLIQMGGGEAARRALPASTVEVPRALHAFAEASRRDETARTNEHYGSKARELSAQIGDRSVLRQFHNWIKSMLLSDVVATAKTQFAGHLFILDVCCGRGGDLHKWKAARPDFLFMTDASVACVAEAAGRYSVSEGMSMKATKERLQGFPARFAVHDAFDSASTLRSELQEVRQQRGHGFAIASCQFSMHYACHSLERITCFVETVSSCLAPGGLFTGTTVSDTALMNAYKKKGATFQCETYGLRFPEDSVTKLNECVAHCAEEGGGTDTVALPFGLSYYVTIENTVSDLPEFVVPWEPFVQLCASFSLRLIQDTAFEPFYEAQKESEEGLKLREAILKKRGRDGTVQSFALSEAEKEAAGLYRAFIFEKQP